MSKGKYLSESERATLTNALQNAALDYRQIANETRASIQTAMESQKPGLESLANQFDAQEKSANELADLIEQANDIHVD